jgi:phospho-N-acetylmuramoyl-pentapeptide-transferase
MDGAPAAQIGDFASAAIDRGEVLIAGMAAMLITIFLGPKFIEFLHLKEFGQHIREEGPQEHHAKAGTPTMGGLIIFVAIAIPYLVLSDRDTQSLAVFGVAMGCAAIGFADDWLKIVKRRSLGLSARWKLLAQIALAGAIWWVALEEVGLDPALTSHIWDAELYLGPVVYLILVFLVIAGASNGVNLTDGLDGLAAGSSAIVLLAYTAITITNGQEGLAVLSACLVAAFKMFRRRVLLMAPIHHHFELLAWSETKIMLRFWIVAAVCGGIGYTLYQNSIGT